MVLDGIGLAFSCRHGPRNWISSTMGMLPSIFCPATASPATDTWHEQKPSSKVHFNRENRRQLQLTLAELHKTYHRKSMLRDELCSGCAGIQTYGIESPKHQNKPFRRWTHQLTLTTSLCQLTPISRHTYWSIYHVSFTRNLFPVCCRVFKHLEYLNLEYLNLMPNVAPKLSKQGKACMLRQQLNFLQATSYPFVLLAEVGVECPGSLGLARVSGPIPEAMAKAKNACAKPQHFTVFYAILTKPCRNHAFEIWTGTRPNNAQQSRQLSVQTFSLKNCTS